MTDRNFELICTISNGAISIDVIATQLGKYLNFKITFSRPGKF